MAKKAAKKPKAQLRSIACKHLVQLDEISNAGNPLCRCDLRDFNVSPYNHVCQICKKYSENESGITHAEIFVAEAAQNFVFDTDELISESDLIEIIEEEEFEPKPTRKKSRSKAKKKKSKVDDDDFDEVTTKEEDEGIVIGHEKEDEEDLSATDEREEGLGRKHGTTGSEDDEDDDLDEDLDEMDDAADSTGNDDIDDSDIDFEADVIAKIKKIGSGDDIKEICPYCQKSKVSVLRHLSKCKRCPPEIIKAHATWKKVKKPTKKKVTKKKK